MTVDPAAPRAARVRGGGITETQYMATIIEAARMSNWMVAHFRPARTVHGWRTPVQADGKGFPDLVLVNPVAGLVWFVELKRGRGVLSPDQRVWGETLIRAGAIYHLVRVPDGLDGFCQALADAAYRKVVV